ncbi:MAG: hypothetical protein RL701_6787 [Pseudomonadota bacterium]
MTSFTPLSTVLALQARGDAFITAIPADWTQGRTTFGGLLAAVAIRATQHGAAGERRLRSFVMDCIGPAGPGELSVITDELRAGKSLSHVRATLSQDGKVCAVVLAVFGQDLTSPLHVPGSAAPAGKTAASELARLPYVPGVAPAFTQHFDYRMTCEFKLFSGTPHGEITGYVRACDADRFDAGLVAALIDAFPPPVLAQMSRPAPTSTVTWLVNLTNVDTATLPPDTFCRYAAETKSAGSGYTSVDASLWDNSGRLLADSRQLVVEFS